MANKLISQMGLPPSVANVFAARNILTAKDALSLPEFELMTLLGMGLDQVKSAVERISEITCPPYQTALSLMEDRVRLGGHLPTLLRGLDDALCGGIPFGALTELVGPSGIGKTQFCLKLSLLAALPSCYGGLNGRVIYIDTESKFSSRRMVEIGESSFPQIFQSEGMAQQMAGRIIVVRLTSLPEFTERCRYRNLSFGSCLLTEGMLYEVFISIAKRQLQQLKLTLIQHDVKLLVVDSMAALVSGGNDTITAGPKQHLLRWPLSFLKSLAEFSRIPVVVTNQVRSQSSNEAFHYPFQGKEKDSSKNFERLESHLIAALGIQWAHAVTIRLVFEAYSGQKFIKVAKSPMSPAMAFPFIVESSGISLLNDDGFKVMGREINTIRFQGHNILEQ